MSDGMLNPPASINFNMPLDSDLIDSNIGKSFTLIPAENKIMLTIPDNMYMAGIEVGVTPGLTIKRASVFIATYVGYSGEVRYYYVFTATLVHSVAATKLADKEQIV